jgi:dimeric dUTPase (all-alpha-NTP-PPase superfamily)
MDENGLKEIFKKQIELNKRISPTIYSDIQNPDIRRKWFLQFALALQQEIAEAIDSTAWKWWKKSEDDWNNIRIELIDILHFWVSMCTMAEMDSDEVIALYLKKIS